jgi:hypothetical protein
LFERLKARQSQTPRQPHGNRHRQTPTRRNRDTHGDGQALEQETATPETDRAPRDRKGTRLDRETGTKPRQGRHNKEVKQGNGPKKPKNAKITVLLRHAEKQEKTEKNTKKEEILLLWTHSPKGPKERETMTDRLAKEINRLLAWTAALALTAGALVLALPISAAITYLLS